MNRRFAVSAAPVPAAEDSLRHRFQDHVVIAVTIQHLQQLQPLQLNAPEWRMRATSSSSRNAVLGAGKRRLQMKRNVTLRQHRWVA